MSGCEAGVHAMREIFNDQGTEAILLVDATNAFNSLNRRAALINIHSLCPPLAIIATNMYRGDAQLFIDGETVYSREGTTQGDPLAMPIYGISILPLIQKIAGPYKQLWFADDASAGGKIEQVREWWMKIQTAGPAFGYFPNPSKTWLLTKEDHLEKAKELFENCNIHITSTGQRHLGSTLGSESFSCGYVSAKISTWVDELERLCEIAKTEPQAAYSALTHGMISKWTYIMRTTPDIAQLMAPLEDTLRKKFIPVITGRVAITNEERQLLALPCRNGGLGIIDPTRQCCEQYDSSVDVTAPLVEIIMEQKDTYGNEIELEQKRRKAKVKNKHRKEAEDEMNNLTLPESLGRVVELSNQKGSSNWLTSLPLECHGFSLHKGAFRDALCLRYGWTPDKLPTMCECGSTFTVNHALNCARGAFPTLRHNEIRNYTGKLLAEVCTDVTLEPNLQPLEGESLQFATSNQEDNARADIRARGFWGSNRQCAFFDVKVFNPNAQSYRRSSLEANYRREEKAKKRMYEERILKVEHGSFTPLVFATTGGMGRLATTFYKRLASMVSEKRASTYSSTLGWIRTHLSFSLLRSAVLCIRGARSSSTHVVSGCNSIDLVMAEARIPQ